MKNLLTKIAAPLLVAGSLFFAQPQKVEAEAKSGFNINGGIFRSDNEDADDYYGVFFGGKIGLDTRIANYFRFTSNLSIYHSAKEDKGVERNATIVQVEPMLQLVSPDFGGGFIYCGAGLNWTHIGENVSYKGENLKSSAEGRGGVLCLGLEFLPKKNSNWGGSIELAHKAVTNDEDIEFGGTSLTVGGKYFFGLNN